MEGLIELKPSDWQRGGMPRDSHVVPWSVQSISTEDIDDWQGRLDSAVVREAIASLVAELESGV